MIVVKAMVTRLVVVEEHYDLPEDFTDKTLRAAIVADKSTVQYIQEAGDAQDYTLAQVGTNVTTGSPTHKVSSSDYGRGRRKTHA